MSKETAKYKIEISTSNGKRSISYKFDEVSYDWVVDQVKEMIELFNKGKGDELRDMFGIEDSNTYLRSHPKLYVVKTQEIKIDI